jgi:hypothetical protein
MTRNNLARFSNKHYEDVAKKLEGKIPSSVEHEGINGNNSTNIHRTLNIRTFPIVIGVPMDELMFSQFFSNIICLSIMPWDSWVTTADTFVTEARNTIHDRFLDKSSAPYLLMIDSDVLPPPDAIERLLAHDKGVVGGWYRKKEKFRVKNLNGTESVIQRPVVYDYDGFNEEIQKFEFRQRLEPGEGLEKVDGMGAGCWLIRRDVAEKIGKSPFSLQYGGEDLSFCRKITGAGYDIFVDWSLACAHIGSFFV